MLHAMSGPHDDRKVMGVGFACLDMLVVWRDAAAPVRDNAAVEMDLQGGGMAATAMAAVARLGGRAELCGFVGDDWAGEMIVRGLAAEGVGVAGVRRVAGASGPISLVSVDGPSGERHFSGFRRLEEPTEPLAAEDAAASAACLLIDDTRPRSAVPAARAARRAGVPVVADFGGKGLADAELLAAADYAIVSAANLRQAGLAAALPDACRAVAARGPRCVVVTRGGEGLACLAGGQLIERPAFAVDVVDTTGAGDVFHGAFCFALAAGLTLADNLAFSSAVAALKCRSLGGRGGIPTLGETLRFLADRGAPVTWPH